MLEKLANGYRLLFPKVLEKATNWVPEELYNKLSELCFVADPKDRGSFADVVKVLEVELNEEELTDYIDQSKAYESTNVNCYTQLSSVL